MLDEVRRDEQTGIIYAPPRLWRGTMIEECGEPLVELNAKEFVLKPEYHRLGYSDTPFIQVRKGVEERLRLSQEHIRHEGERDFNIQVWDGMRSLTVQQMLWFKFRNEILQVCPEIADDYDEQVRRTNVYVSKPIDGDPVPRHRSGGAVDVTIVDGKGRELDFGTEFDSFESTAGTDYFRRNLHTLGDNSPERARWVSVINNRDLLVSAMAKAGFNNYKPEWWHYDYGNWQWAHDNRTVAIYGSAEMPKAA